MGLARSWGWQPGDVAGQQGVADEGHGVDQRMRDDQRGYPAVATVEDAEDDAHGGVAEEGADALVQVVGAADHGAEGDGRDRVDAELVQPAEQVSDDDDLFEDAVLGGRQDQYREAPPDVGQVLGDDVQLHAGVVGDQVQAQARSADHRGQQGAPAQVLPRLAEVHAKRLGRPLPGPSQQVEHQQYRGQRQGDVGEPQEQVEQRPAGGQRAVHDHGLLADRLLRGQRADVLDQGVDAAGAEGHGEDGHDLPAH